MNINFKSVVYLSTFVLLWKLTMNVLEMVFGGKMTISVYQCLLCVFGKSLHLPIGWGELSFHSLAKCLHLFLYVNKKLLAIDFGIKFQSYVGRFNEQAFLVQPVWNSFSITPYHTTLIYFYHNVYDHVMYSYF